MSSATATIEEAEILIHSAPFFVFNVVAVVTVLFWDMFITLGEEVEFIWKAKYGFTKILFIVVRVLSMILTLGLVFGFEGVWGSKTNLCHGLMWFIGCLGASLIFCANLLMVNRAYAVYGKNKALLYVLLSAFFAHEITVVIILAITIPDFHIIKTLLPSPFPRISGECVSVSSYSRTLSYIWLSGLLFQSIASGSIFARFMWIKAHSQKLGVKMSTLYTVCLRDGLYVYVTLTVTYCLCIGFNQHPGYTGITFAVWSFTASSICCTRLILSLHASWERLRRENKFGPAALSPFQ